MHLFHKYQITSKLILLYGALLISTMPLLGQTLFEDVTIQTGIDHAFEPFQGTFGGGVAILDFDDDGLEDIYLVGGIAPDSLYKNLGNGTFQNVSINTGILELTNQFVTQGVTSSDVNKDGCIDIFVTTIASSDGLLARANDLLFINNCDGTFRYASQEFNLEGHKTFSTGASFGDINNDGYPDLFVANYFGALSDRLDHFAGNVFSTSELSRDQLYINVGGEHFEEVSLDYGVSHRGFGFGGLFSDYDNDGDLDLFVVNDFGDKATPNLLYRNDYPISGFTDVSNEMNFNLGMNGMGASVGDYNNDGWMDYFVTNMTASPFYLGQGANLPFRQSSTELGTAFHSLFIPNIGSAITVSWGTNFFDYDQDGDLDLFFSNGCLNPSLFPNPNIMLENFNGFYHNISVLSGLDDISISRGSVTLDYDNDGDFDLLVVNQRPIELGVNTGYSHTKIYKNNASTGNWLKVKLKGRRSDSNGIGSRIEVVAGSLKMIREVDGGSSHESQNSTVAHFGIGNATIIDTLKVKWLGGSEQILTHVLINKEVTIVEDQDKPDADTENYPKVLLYPTQFENDVNISIEFSEESPYLLTVVDLLGRVLDRIRYNIPKKTSTISWSAPISMQNGMCFFIIQWDGDKKYLVEKAIKI